VNIFISGGCKNGKSGFAQDIAVNIAGGGKLYYVATMIPCDGEDRERIKSHIENRAGLGFETLECERDIMSCLAKADKGGAFLVDSVTALLLNEMFSGTYDVADRDAAGRCRAELISFAQSVANAVFVSDYIYSDAERYDDFTENYRRSLALIDRAMAAQCETVLEMSVGQIILHKGRLDI
jgi:adenosylcobinamide kinase/adenosylcobinamide-phosphate guanylyltransferase